MNDGVHESAHPVQVLMVLASVALILWGLVCIVTGADYIGEATVDFESAAQRNTLDVTIHADIFFIVYGCLAFLPPLAFFYARLRSKHPFAPTMTFFYFGFVVYTIVGVIGGVLYSQELSKLPGDLKTVAMILYGVIAVPVIILLVFIISACKCPNVKCIPVFGRNKERTISSDVSGNIWSDKWQNPATTVLHGATGSSDTEPHTNGDIATSASNEFQETQEPITVENQNFSNEPYLYMGCGNFDNRPAIHTGNTETQPDKSGADMLPSYWF